MLTGERWWTDVEKAQQVLSIVGGDDVAQSVGTVALGYHAHVADKLRPLATRTLVDHADVGNALDDVDLFPVMKAMMAAVSPVLGSAAGVYAADLVDQLHTEARDGIRHELQILTSKGVAWPQAIERVCGVAGVPARAVNGYVQKMAAPQVNPRVLADEGDRTLMTWASRLGAREATPPLQSPVAKQGEFEEQEHPRSGETGRFVPAGDEEDREAREDRISRLSRLARLSRKAGQRRQAQVEQMTEEKRLAEKKTLAQLQDEVLGRAAAPGRAQRGRAQQGRSQQGRSQQGRAQAKQPEPEAQTRSLERRSASPRWSVADSGLKLAERAYVDVDPSRALLFTRHMGDTVPAYEIARGGGDRITTDPGEQENGTLRLIFDDARASHDHGGGEYDLDLNHDYEIVDIGTGGPLGLDYTMVLRRVGEGTGSGPPDPFNKADFDEAEHPRDEGGRFATDERRQRMDRLARLAQMSRKAGQKNQQRAQQAEQADKDRAAEESAAAAALARPAAQRAQRGRAQRGRAQRGRLQATGRRAQDAAEVEGEGKDQQSLAQLARAEQRKARDAELLSHYKSALLVDDFTVTQLTGHYAGSPELDDGVPLLSQKDKSPNELRAMTKNALLTRTSEVGRQLSMLAMGDIRRSIASKDNVIDLVDEDDAAMYFSTPEEALDEAKLLMMGQDVDYGDTVLVPGVRRNSRSGLFQPVGMKQPFREPDDSPDTPKHVITGSDEALFRLQRGDTAGLRIRQVDQGLDGDALEKMGGGHASLPYAQPWIESSVLEVVDTRQE